MASSKALMRTESSHNSPSFPIYFPLSLSLSLFPAPYLCLRSHVSSELHPRRPSQSNSARLGPKCDRLCIVSPLKLSIGGPIYSSSPTTRPLDFGARAVVETYRASASHSDECACF